MKEVTRLKSLETNNDAGDLSYFSLAAGKPSRHIDPFIITVDPSGETSHKLVGHEGEEWLYGMEGCTRVNPFTTIPSFRMKCARMTARRPSSSPSCTRRSRGGWC